VSSIYKILHTADWHLGKRLMDYSRLEEQRDVMDELVEMADRESVDAVVIAGDLFDVFHPSHEAQDLFYKTLFRLSKNGQRPVIAIAGNHDSHALIEAPLPLAKELGIILLGANQQMIAPMTNAAGVEIAAPENGVVTLRYPDGRPPMVMLTAPYANEMLLKIYLGNEDREDDLRELLREKWNQLAQKYFTSDSINVFIGHFFFMKEGGTAEEEPEGERSILHIGGAQAMYTDHLPDGLHYAALGHLHRYQIVDNRRFPVVYSSAVLNYSFSEAGQEKYGVIVSLGGETSLKPISLERGYKLHRVEFSVLQDALDWLAEHQNTYVELTFVTDDSLDAATRKALMTAHERIVHLIPKRRNQEAQDGSRIKAEDLQLDVPSLFEKFYAQQNNGMPPNEELMELLKEVMNKGGDE